MRSGASIRTAVAVALLAAIGVAFLNRGNYGAASLQAWVGDAGALGPLLFVAVYAIATVLFFPGSVLTLAGGALFGPVLGSLYSLAGATVGAVIAFLIARYVAGDWVGRKAQGWLAGLVRGVDDEGWHFVAFVRLMPLFPFNLLNYALGLTRIPLAQYAAASAICMLPGAFAYAYIGYAGREALGGGDDVLRKVVLGVTLVAALGFVPRLVRRFRGEAHAPRAADPQEITASELRRRIDAGNGIPVIDVRSPQDYAGNLGHVEGALNIPLADLRARLPAIEHLRRVPFAVMCRTNRMSGEAVQLLRHQGFAHAMLVTDGMLGWRQSSAQGDSGRTASS